MCPRVYLTVARKIIKRIMGGKMEFLVVLVPAVAMIAFAIIVKAIVENLVKLKIANKDNPQNDPNQALKQRKPYKPLTNLKWGFVLAGLGLALILKEYILPSLSQIGLFGFMFLFAGLGFILYFILFKKDSDKKETDSTDAG